MEYAPKTGVLFLPLVSLQKKPTYVYGSFSCIIKKFLHNRVKGLFIFYWNPRKNIDNMETYAVDKTLYEIGANDLVWDSDLDPVRLFFFYNFIYRAP